jgi:hypothetical protein
MGEYPDTVRDGGAEKPALLFHVVAQVFDV